MANAYETGAQYSSTLPNWQRTYYEGLLLETIRMRSMLVPYCAVKEDFAARQTGLINYSEVYDTEPNWNPLNESNIWLGGSNMDSRSVNIQLEIHGDMLKFSDYADVVQYINNGDLRGLVREKIGQNLIDTLDILARNAFLSHPNVVLAGGARATREDILATDIFNADYAELARTHLEENNIPGLSPVQDSDIQTIVCVTTPRVIHDIRVGAGSNWIDIEKYAGAVRKFNGEVGTWDGVRFVRSNRLVLRNHGKVAHQTTLSAPVVPGQGAAQTVDSVYSVGQASSTRYIPVTASAGFVVGDYITLHSKDAGAGAGKPPVETDGTQETRRIVAIDLGGLNRLTLDKPLLKAHVQGDFVTVGVNLHNSIFMGGPAVVYGIGERPTPVMPPKFDDLMMINRVGWRGFFKFQMFRPEFVEVHTTSGTSN